MNATKYWLCTYQTNFNFNNLFLACPLMHLARDGIYSPYSNCHLFIHFPCLYFPLEKSLSSSFLPIGVFMDLFFITEGCLSKVLSLASDLFRFLGLESFWGGGIFLYIYSLLVILAVLRQFSSDCNSSRAVQGRD